MLNKSTRPISTGLSEISETSHEPNSTQESESLDLADIESRDVTQYDDDSDRIGLNIIWLIYMTHIKWLIYLNFWEWQNLENFEITWLFWFQLNKWREYLQIDLEI